MEGYPIFHGGISIDHNIIPALYKDGKGRSLWICKRLDLIWH